MLIYILEYINKKERENFSKMRKLIEDRKDRWLERQEEGDTEPEPSSDEENGAVRGKEAKHFKRLKPKGLTLEKAIEELNKEDQEKPDHVVPGGSYVSIVVGFYFDLYFQPYYKNTIDLFTTKEDNDMMFSHHFTSRCAVQFLVVYGDLKGLFCFKRKSKIGEKEITNLVIAKDAELSEKKGFLKAD